MANYFPKSCRLRKTWEFKHAWKVGCKSHTPHFILLREKNCQTNCNRLGLTVSRKVGNAVQRNRVKRLLREFFRTRQILFSEPVNLSVVAKRGAADLSAEQIHLELEKALR